MSGDNENCTGIMDGARPDRGVITMRILMISLMLLISCCVMYKPVPMEPASVEKDIVLPWMTEKKIYEKSKEWIERHLYSKGHIIEVADKNSGLIVANGFIGYPAAGNLDEIDKIQYTISFTMQANISDQGMKIIFRDLLVDIPKNYYHGPRLYHIQEYYGGYSVPVTEKGDYEAARRGLLELAGRLGEYLKRTAGE